MTTSTKKTMRVCAWLAGALLASGIDARAQGAMPYKFLVGATIGGQIHAHTFSATENVPLRFETATVAGTQGVSSGFLVDVNGACRFWRPDFGVGIRYSHFSDSGDASVIASIPHPLFFDRPEILTLTFEGLDRREIGVHFQALWFPPVPDFLPDDVEIILGIGPSILNAKQQVPSITVPEGTQDVVAAPASQSKTGVGLNVGIDVTYPVAPRYGVGGFIRYAGGSVDLPAVEDMTVGGFQMGIGVRMKF